MLRSFLTPNFRKGLSSTLTATCWNSSCSAAASRLQNQELTSWPGWASHHHYHHQQQSQHISTPSPVSLVIVSPRLFDFGRRAFHTRALQRQRSSKNKKTPSKLQKSLNKVVVPNEEAPLAKRFLHVLTADPEKLLFDAKSTHSWIPESVKAARVDLKSLNNLHKQLLSKHFPIADGSRKSFCEECAKEFDERSRLKENWGGSNFKDWFSGAYRPIYRELPTQKRTKLISNHLFSILNCVFLFSSKVETLQEYTSKLNERRKMRDNEAIVNDFLSMSSVFTYCVSAALAKDRTPIQDRNVKFAQLLHGLSKAFVSPTKPGLRICDYWSADPRKVLILSGSSGCGKTIGAITIAKEMGRKNVVFYILASIRAFLCKGKGTAERDDEAVKWIKKCIDEIFKDIPACIKDDGNGNWKVFIVVDEIGFHPLLLRGIISASSRILIECHNQVFKMNQITDYKDSRFRIIVAGTGASYQTEFAGTDPDGYDTFRFETGQRCDKENGLNFFDHLVKTSQFLIPGNKTEDDRIRTLLLRLEGKTQMGKRTALEVEYNNAFNKPPQQQQHQQRHGQELPTDWITPLEIEASHLVLNARCAALLVQKVIEVSNAVFWWGSVASFNEKLRSWLPDVVVGYVKKNGLQHERFPEEVLKRALAFTLFPIPFLPQTAMYKQLITEGGVLIDLIDKKIETPVVGGDQAKSPASNANEDHLDLLRFFPKALQNKVTEGGKKHVTFLDVKNNGYSRFLLYPAHLAMLRSLCGLSMGRSPDFSYSFEQNVADFCALNVICAPVIADLFGDVPPKGSDPEQKYPSFGCFQNDANAKHIRKFLVEIVAPRDNLYGLKRLLSQFKYKVHGVKVLQLIDSPLRNMLKYGSKYAKDADEDEDEEIHLLQHFHAKCAILKARIVAALRNGQAVIFLSREMESFADIVLVGPGRVFLFQCKQSIQKNEDVKKVLDIKFSEELDKMACFDDPYWKSQKQYRIYDKDPQSKDIKQCEIKSKRGQLRGLFVEMLKEAAAAGASKNQTNVREVEVHACFIVEADSASETKLKNKFDGWWTTASTTSATESAEHSISTSTISNSLAPKQVTFTYKKDLNSQTTSTHVAFVHHFVVPRSKVSAESFTRMSRSSFYPIPQTSELLDDNGKSIVISEHQSRDRKE
jgi:hypothetical protein